MSKLSRHLDSLKVSDLELMRVNGFVQYAECIGDNLEVIKVGVNCFGQYVVIDRGEWHNYNDPEEALEKYKELIEAL